MASLHLLIHFPNPTTKRSCISPSDSLPSQRRQIGLFLSRNGGLLSLPLALNAFRREGFGEVGILPRRGRRAGLLAVRAKQVFGSGDGGWDKGSSSRVLGNLVLAIGLTYLTVTGQLGWLFDALVSIWLLAFLLPIVGFGVFFWFAGRNLIQSNCPNCGNYFQILKSSMKDGVQLCPYCTQPFSVQGNKFEREPTRFSSKKSGAAGRTSMGSRPYAQQGASSAAIVDIEAEVKDIE